MSFQNVFGGTTIYPSDVTYLALALTADVTLEWPLNASTAESVVARIIDITSTAAYAITMPPADETGTGQTVQFTNLSAYTITVKNSAGSTILSLATGTSWQLYLTSNATAAGSWRTLQYGSLTSQAQASALAGYGLAATGALLSQSIPATLFNADFTLTDASRATAYVWTGGLGTLTLPSAVTVGSNWFSMARNEGTGNLTLDPPGAETINSASSLVLTPGDSAIVFTDGSDFFTVGLGQDAVFAFDHTSINLAGQSGDYVLSGSELNRISYTFTGALAGNVEVVVPATTQQYWVTNSTTGGSYTVRFKTSGQSPAILVARDAAAILKCDGTNVSAAETEGVATPIAVVDGGTGSTTAGGALINLGGTATGIAVFTSASAAAARLAIGGAASGVNSDITELTGLTTPLTVAQGGTASATAGGALINLGGTSTGIAVFTAATPAAGRVALGITAANVVYASNYSFSTDPLFDNGPLMREALADAIAAGAELVFDLAAPSGEYYWVATGVSNYVMNPSASFVMRGLSKFLTRFKQIDGIKLGWINFANLADWSISDIQFDCNLNNRDGSIGAHGIRLGTTAYDDISGPGKIEDVAILYANGYGIGFEGDGGYQHITVEDCFITGSSSDNVDMKDDRGLNKDVRFVNLTSENFDYNQSGDVGLDLRGVGVQVEGYHCVMDADNAGSGIRTRFQQSLLADSTSGSAVLTNTSIDPTLVSLTIGDPVTGPNIPENSLVDSFTSTTITLSELASSTLVQAQYITGHGGVGCQIVAPVIDVGGASSEYNRTGMILGGAETNVRGGHVFNGARNGNNVTIGIQITALADGSRATGTTIEDQGIGVQIGCAATVENIMVTSTTNAGFVTQRGFEFLNTVDPTPQGNQVATGARAIGCQAFNCGNGYTVRAPGVWLEDIDAIGCTIGVSVLATAIGTYIRPRRFENNGDDWSILAPVYIDWGSNPPALSKVASYTFKHGDVGKTLVMTTGASDRNVTMPDTGLAGRVFVVVKGDSGAGHVLIKDSAAVLLATITTQYQSFTVRENASATGWEIY